MLTTDEWRAREASTWPEARLQSHVEGLARDLGWRVYHAPDNRPGRTGRVQRIVPGWPDLVAVHARQKRIVYAELKATKGRVTPEQREWLDDLALAGAETHVWRPIDYLNGAVRAVLTGAPPCLATTPG